MSNTKRRRVRGPTEPAAGPMTSEQLYTAAQMAAFVDHDPKRAALFEEMARAAERREQGLPPAGEAENGLQEPSEAN